MRYYQRRYAYDKLGNINQVLQQGTNGFTRNYVYNSGQNTLNRIDDATPTTIESYTYDACGNTLTTNLNRYYVWNHADQLLSYYNSAGGTPSVFTQYDYAGQDRVSKLVRTGTHYERTVYIDGIFEYVVLETPGTTYEKNYIHIMDDQTRIAEFRINPGAPFPGDISDNEAFILQDQIGSSVSRLNTSGTIIDEEEYYPFGDSSLRTFTYKRYRYVGKEKDGESGLYYYGARYYAAWVGRFVSVDPLSGDYMYLTPFNYAANNPIDDFDIDGMQDNNSQPDSSTGNAAVPPAPANQPQANINQVSNQSPYNTQITMIQPDGNKVQIPQSTNNLQIDPAGNLRGFTDIDGKQFYWSEDSKGYIFVDPKLFEGVQINDSEIGDLKEGAAFTLPLLGIFLSQEYYKNKPKEYKDLLRHEFGHWLYYNKFGSGVFLFVAPVSIYSAKKDPFNHKYTWTEYEANQLSYDYFNQPSDWNHYDYPTIDDMTSSE